MNISEPKAKCNIYTVLEELIEKAFFLFTWYRQHPCLRGISQQHAQSGLLPLHTHNVGYSIRIFLYMFIEKLSIIVSINSNFSLIFF